MRGGVTMTPMNQPHGPSHAASASIGEVRDAIADLQRSVREVLAEADGLKSSRSVDVVAALGIDLKLAWKVTKIAQSGDPFSCVRHLPGVGGWGIFGDALARRGAAAGRIAAATAAFERVLRLGEAWAGSRRNFLALAAGAVRVADKRLDTMHRKQLHESGACVWGVHARAAIRIDAVAPAGHGRVDCASIRAALDIERLRAEAPWWLDPPMVVDDDGVIRDLPRLDPIDGGSAGGGPPYLMPEFCSQPLPQLVAVPFGPRGRRLELAEGEIGPAGRCSIVHGAVLRSVQSSVADATDHGLFQRFPIRTPATVQIFDLFMHEAILETTEAPEAILYADLGSAGDPGVRYGSRDRIPCAIEVERLGRGLRRARLPEWGRQIDAAKAIFASTGWSPGQFQLFRVRLAYPPVPSTLSIELPFVA
jgi:hypothetical protein